MVADSLVSDESGDVVVSAKDAKGNIVTAYTGTIRFSSSDPYAELPASYTFSVKDRGTKEFLVKFQTAGAQTISIYDTRSTTQTFAKIEVNVEPGIPVDIDLTVHPDTALAGISNTIVATVKDSFGNIVTDYTGTIAFSSSDPSSVLPTNYTFTLDDAGVHSFPIVFQTSGSQSFTLTDTEDELLTKGQSGISVKAGPIQNFNVANFPSSAGVGSSNTVTVTARDAFGNIANDYVGTVHLSSSDSSAVLPSDYTFVTDDQGVKVFSVTLKTSGAQSIIATDTVSSITGNQSGIGVVSGPASSLVINGYPSTTTAGTSNSFAVSARDLYGNIATNYIGTIHLASSDLLAVLPSDYSFVAGDAGIKNFSVPLKTSGIQSITVTDTVTGSLNSSQTGISVVPAAAVLFNLSGYPSSTTAGLANNLTVTAKDAYGNTASTYVGTVALTSSDPAATLPTNFTFVSGNAGVKVFSATLKTAGTRSITVTDAITGSIPGLQGGIVVSASSANNFSVSGYPASVAAGSSHNLVASVKDAYGNAVSSYVGTVHFTSSDLAAVLPPDYTFVAGDAGLKTFSATLKTGGTRSITATATVTGSLTGSQSGINVTGGAPASLVLAEYPTSPAAGTSNSFSVTAKDTYGNTATSYLGTVSFTSSDPSAVLPSNYTFVAEDGGVKSFTASLKTSGAQSITATDTVTGSLNSSQTGITVTPLAAVTLTVSGYPSSTIAGVANNLTITAKDTYGNTATSYLGTVAITSNDPTAILPANATFVAGNAGVKVVSVTLKTSGTRSITGTDTITSSITGLQTGIVVSPSTASVFLADGYPASVVAGTANNLVLTVKDAYGNIATGYVGTVNFTSTDVIPVLPANYTFTSGDAGVKTFSVTLKRSGTQSITVTDTVSTSLTSTQSGITVAPGNATLLTVTGASSPTPAEISSAITVSAHDAYSNIATGYTGTVAITSTDAGATLPASAAFIAANAGVKTFAVTLNTRGTQSITATDTVTSSITGSQTGIVVKYYFLYAANSGAGTISIRKITMSTGALTGSTNFATGATVSYLAATTDGKYLYATVPGSNQLNGFSIAPATGVLTLLAGFPLTTGASPRGVTIDPTNKFLYFTNATDNRVRAYTINSATGALTIIAGSPFITGTLPVYAKVDPTGKFLYVANTTSGSISGYTIDSTTGVLTAISGSPFTTGAGVSGLDIHPNGAFLYAAAPTSANVYAYTINTTTGALTQINFYAAPANPQSVVVSPGAGNYLYTANAKISGGGSANSVSNFAINAVTGSLTSIVTAPAGPYAVGNNTRPMSVTVDPTGRYVYTGNYGAAKVSGYSLNSANGTLTAVPGASFSVSTNPTQVIVVEE